jgi:ADP-heptose:LPS heptosyltransferase
MNDPFVPGLFQRLSEPPRKVVLLRASRIGDFICTTPAFRALRAALPHAEITLITLPLLRDLVERLPYLDRFVAFPGFPGIAEQFFDPREALSFFQAMQAERFDLAIQLQGSGVNSNPFMLLLGARYTAGFIRQGAAPGLLDAALPWPLHGHEIQRMLSILRFLGVDAHCTDTEYPLWPQDHADAERLLAGTKRPFIGLHTAARDATRRWPLDRFIVVAKTLHSRHGGTIVFLGEETEHCVGEEIARIIGAESCLNLAGKTSLPVLGAVIARLSLLVTNDTGPAHVAYALKTPTVTIFGGGSPEAYAPLQNGPFHILLHEVPCRPCGYAVCPIGNACLQAVTVEDVVDATIRLSPICLPNRAFYINTSENGV